MQSDPYKILGIDKTATDEEVKRAYRELAKKYHPDNYANTPLADLAEEKMKEINEAYDTIRTWRKESEAHSEPFGTQTPHGREDNAHSRFHEIRGFIHENNFYEAEIRLNSVQKSEKGAEWYFLKGVIFRARGWYFEAAKYFEAALRMDPGNPEYLAAWEGIRSFISSRTHIKKENAVCDLCCGLMALDCCCECCGGDLISCC